MNTARRDSGFTLVELLVASLITVAVMGAAFALISPAHAVFQAQPEVADEQQRMRVGVDALSRDLTMAGAGVDTGSASGTLTSLVAPLMPYRAFGDEADPLRGVFFKPDAMSFLYLPSAASQTRLSAPLLPGVLSAELEAVPNCPPPTAQTFCGIETGDRLLLFDEVGRWDVFNVGAIAGGTLVLQHRGAPVERYEAGTAVAKVEMGTYFLGTDTTTGVSRLTRYDGWVTDSPVVDNVVQLEFRYFAEASAPERTDVALGDPVGPWTTYGPAPPLAAVARGRWPPGENCTFGLVNGDHVPRLPAIGAGGISQVELTAAMLSDGPWCPDDAFPGRFDADALRIRRVHVSLRVQSSLAALRGPAGVLFMNGGTARAANRYVPDMVAQFDVTPRNMNRGR